MDEVLLENGVTSTILLKGCGCVLLIWPIRDLFCIVLMTLVTRTLRMGGMGGTQIYECYFELNDGRN